MVCRTGYTGERGYELIVRNDAAVELWDALLAAGEEFGMLACGLGARDTLRTEMGYPLHGQDITLDVTPNQARLGWAVGWKKDAFWGRDALLAEKEAGVQRLLRGLVAVGRGIPRPGMTVSLTPDVAPLRDHLRHLLAHAAQGRSGWRWCRRLVDRGRRGGRRRPRATRDLPARRSAVRRPVRARVLTWRTFPTSPRPSGRPTPAERPWRWRLENATGAEVAVGDEYAGQRFASQADAESWVGEIWSELAVRGRRRA